MRLISLELQAEEERRAWAERQRRYRPPLLVLGRNMLLGTANRSA
jgi:hypothetical protein